MASWVFRDKRHAWLDSSSPRSFLFAFIAGSSAVVLRAAEGRTSGMSPSWVMIVSPDLLVLVSPEDDIDISTLLTNGVD